MFGSEPDVKSNVQNLFLSWNVEPQNWLFSGGSRLQRKYHGMKRARNERKKTFSQRRVLHSLSKLGELWPTNGWNLVADFDPLSRTHFTTTSWRKREIFGTEGGINKQKKRSDKNSRPLHSLKTSRTVAYKHLKFRGTFSSTLYNFGRHQIATARVAICLVLNSVFFYQWSLRSSIVSWSLD